MRYLCALGVGKDLDKCFCQRTWRCAQRPHRCDVTLSNTNTDTHTNKSDNTLSHAKSDETINLTIVLLLVPHSVTERDSSTADDAVTHSI